MKINFEDKGDYVEWVDCFGERHRKLKSTLKREREQRDLARRNTLSNGFGMPSYRFVERVMEHEYETIVKPLRRHMIKQLKNL